jgi:hypothetical protein
MSLTSQDIKDRFAALDVRDARIAELEATLRLAGRLAIEARRYLNSPVSTSSPDALLSTLDEYDAAALKPKST